MKKNSGLSADRKAYFTWLNRAQTWTGGNSYRKFLANIEAESLKGFTENEKLALETLGVRETVCCTAATKA